MDSTVTVAVLLPLIIGSRQALGEETADAVVGQNRTGCCRCEQQGFTKTSAHISWADTQLSQPMMRRKTRRFASNFGAVSVTFQ